MLPCAGAILAATLALAAAIPTPDIGTDNANQAEGIAARAGVDRKWWETAVIYQIYPRSFKDSNGDGIGDLNGITSKLDHLRDIGVDALWLSPIYPSPQKDFGYDISNFTDIDPTYGTLEDFKKLREESKKLGLKLILDFVPNHSSDEHEWFKKSVKRDGKYSNYYVWHAGKTDSNGKRIPPNNWRSNFRGSAWEWNEERGEYYLHQFVQGQPDLNYRSQDLVNEMKDALRFWLRLGVDGFRVDAIPCLFETGMADEPRSGLTDDPEEFDYLDHVFTQNQPETYDMVAQWRKVLEEFSDDLVMMTEQYTTVEKIQDAIKYYGDDGKPGAHLPFNFYLISALGRNSTAKNFTHIIDLWMNQMDNDLRKPNWVIGNHDKNRVAAAVRYGPELADGILMLEMTLPGTAMTYNGEEIGMEDTFIRWDETLDPWAKNKGEKDYLSVSRDPQRTPFQWDKTTSAGFSKNPKTWLPVNPNYYRLNLAAQKQAKHSHYHIYKALIQARKQKSMQSSNYKATAEDNILIVKRWIRGEIFYLAVNFNSYEIEWNVPEEVLYGNKAVVWTASMNSKLRPKDKVSDSIVLQPKAAVLLTNASS